MKHFYDILSHVNNVEICLPPDKISQEEFIKTAEYLFVNYASKVFDMRLRLPAGGTLVPDMSVKELMYALRDTNPEKYGKAAYPANWISRHLEDVFDPSDFYKDIVTNHNDINYYYWAEPAEDKPTGIIAIYGQRISNVHV